MKKAITEKNDQQVIEQWFKDAKGKDGVKSLDEFYRHLMNDYQHDYGTCCHAIVAMAVAAIEKMSREFGITGFQHSCVMWGIIRREFRDHNKLGLRLLDYDNLLFPQYQNEFRQCDISAEQAEKIRKQAQANLDERGIVAPEVKAWWTLLATGWLPDYVKVEGRGQASA